MRDFVVAFVGWLVLLAFGIKMGYVQDWIEAVQYHFGLLG